MEAEDSKAILRSGFLESPGLPAGSGEACCRPDTRTGPASDTGREGADQLALGGSGEARHLARASHGRGSYPGENKLPERGSALHEPGGNPEPRSDRKG